MTLDLLDIRNFRNIRGGIFELSPQVNLIVGANGAGKTAVLEAVYFLARGRSFRGANLRHLLGEKQQEMAVFARLRNTSGVETRVGMGVRNGCKILRIDGKDEKSAAVVAQLLPVSVLVPQSHGILERGPGYRRRLMDWGLFHVEPAYGMEARSYARVLAQRNAMLKTRRGDRAFWEELLAQEGEAVHERRQAYINELNNRLDSVSARMLSKRVTLEVRSGWAARRLSLREALNRVRRIDESRGYTSVGPHRGDLVVRMGTRRAERFASRGEQKLVVASIVLAQARFAQERRAGEMLLLVDDFGAELDRRSRKAFLEEIRFSQCQVLMTAIDQGDVPESTAARVFHVEQGTLVPG